MPFGVQIGGAPHDEATLLRIAIDYQAAHPYWAEAPPEPLSAVGQNNGAIGDLASGPTPVARRVDPGARAALAPGIPIDATRGSRGAVVALRVTDGAQIDRFDEASRRLLVESEYRVSSASDRMGLRLEGAPIAPPDGGAMLTEGMPLGAIQIPPAGQPVILFVDHQTTGGYPVIASVASADLSAVAQLRPQGRVRFERITFDEARRLLRLQGEAIDAASRFVS